VLRVLWAGGESWTVRLRGAHLGACPHIQEQVLRAVLQLCPGAGASGLGVARKHGRGGLYNLTMGVCDRRKEIHEFSGDWPSVPSPLPQTLLQTGLPAPYVDEEIKCLFRRNPAPCLPPDCCNTSQVQRVCGSLDRCARQSTVSRSHSMHSGSRSSSSSPPETSDWTLEQLLQTFFQHSAVGCAPLEKIGRDSLLLPPSHPNGAADEAVAWLFAHESAARGGEGGGSLGTPAWSNVSGYIHELVMPSIVYSDRGSSNESVASSSSSASASASPAPSFEVEDQGDGRYVMVYNMTRSGLYQIDVVGESGLSLHGAAYDVRVEPGPTEPAVALINLESAQASDLRHVIAGLSTVLDIALRDLHGNRRWAWEGGETYARRLREGPGRSGLRNLSDAFTLSIRPMHVPFFNAVKSAQETAVWHASFSKLTWQDYGGGLIRADYTVTTAGLFSLEIALDGIPLGGGSPYQFRIRPGASDMSATTVFGAVSACNAGVRCGIHVEVRDTWGNRRVLEDDSGPNCHRDGLLANCVPVDSPKVPNGQLSSCLNPATGQPGEKWAGDAWCGEASIGSFLVIFPPHAQQRRQGPEMLLLTPANIYSGGYNITSAGSYRVSVVWDATAGGTRTVVNGPHLVHIRHSPFVMNITAAETSAYRSALRGSCAAAAFAQQACTMMLGLRDTFDNPRVSGGDRVAAFLLGPLAERAGEGDAPQGSEEPVLVRDLLNGEFLLTFLLTVPGAYSLAVSVAGSNIKGSPMRINVRGGFAMTSFENMPLVNRSLLLVGHASVQGSLPPSPRRIVCAPPLWPQPPRSATTPCGREELYVRTACATSPSPTPAVAPLQKFNTTRFFVVVFFVKKRRRRRSRRGGCGGFAFECGASKGGERGGGVVPAAADADGGFCDGVCAARYWEEPFVPPVVIAPISRRRDDAPNSETLSAVSRASRRRPCSGVDKGG
jgi:hypothetical protein